MTDPTWTGKVRQGDLVKVVWNDACEGPLEQILVEPARTRLAGLATVVVSSIGRYFAVSNGYLILDDVIREEYGGTIVFEKQAEGKWLSIPLGVVKQIIPIGDVASQLSRETRRRRTIFRQLKFIPRARRLPTGEVSRMLYLA